ncbi:type II toxin-antitoxin system RelE/ParE family toxin [Nodularia spumigena CS-591/12]|uniref:Plasmid stabilization system n=1 Tax=Nodularia spumigena CENA596 TaxID=1819295 RepID=A0A166K743_NODSP|nr:type II toxin-antitoxin system RelE/ParE family toxin [Nodularia spumigena]KZL50669.1 plasmid stabilization system [Nodularia spumigena CENA596]MDB9303423.1 type II toxin-antitoxin system RelE/ParE family toxin [Nodularia spumigena CS-591/12]MDB9346511.1 type II toxin-antitoxin system RelE/ParE family toxin [Nodularia spumigena CS-588/01]MDB9352888.1 type II toxin-antitoxin system RelE/ParE family toxin [Nodularia spumigena CS-588/05]
MFELKKRPQVIRDLIDLATYIAEDSLDVSDRFLIAAEATFKQLSKTPAMGKHCQFSHPNLADIRQQSIKGFRKYLIFYRLTESEVDILRVIHGARDIEGILDEDL